MKKYLLILLFLVLLFSEMLGLRIGIVQGVSVKNLLIYLMLILISFGGINTQSKDKVTTNIKLLHFLFISLILLAFFSWLFTDIQHPVVLMYTKSDRFTALKGLLIDNYLFLIVYYYGSTRIKDVMFVLKCVLFLISITTVITVIDVYDIPDLGIIKQMEDNEAGRGRIQGPLGEPNQYAAFLVFFMPIYIAFAKKEKGLFRYFCAASILLMAIVFVLTGSRGGLVGLICGIFIGVGIFWKYIKIRKIVSYAISGAVVVFFVLSIALYKYSDVLVGRVEATTNAVDAVEASAGRLWIWEQGINQMNSNVGSYLYGMGWYTYKGIIGVNSHNTYLSWLFELGILGLLLNIFIICNILKVVLKDVSFVDTHTRVLIGGFVFGYIGLLVAVFFVNLFNPWVFIWAYIGLIMRVINLMKVQSHCG